MDNYIKLIGRLLMAQVYLIAGISKITGYTGTQAYMSSMGVPGALLPLVIALEIGGSLALVIGWGTRWAAFALAGFTLAAALIFHHNFGDQIQQIIFMCNLAMAGGLFILAASGPGALSLDKQ